MGNEKLIGSPSFWIKSETFLELGYGDIDGH